MQTYKPNPLASRRGGRKKKPYRTHSRLSATFPGAEYTPDQLEFMKAMEKAQKRFGRLDAGDRRVLAVAKSLGYRRVSR